jgi:DNA mismatch endonuclease (patch repair protein)
MQANRRRDTKPERLVRSALHGRGLRFRVDYPLVVNGRRVRPDVVFTTRRVVVFVDGCFWHRCPIHANSPRNNASYWQTKLASNVARDSAVDGALRSAGWDVVRVWEHDEPQHVADLVANALKRERPTTQR